MKLSITLEKEGSHLKTPPSIAKYVHCTISQLFYLYEKVYHTFNGYFVKYVRNSVPFLEETV